MRRQGHLLIAGGSRGLGRVLAQQAVEEQGWVSVISRREPEERVEGVLYRQADLTDPARVEDAVADLVGRAGPLTALALVQRFRGPGDAWQGELDTSLTAARDLIEAAVPRFGEEGGAIAVTGSIASRLVLEEQSLGYHVARAGLEQLVRYYAVQLGPRGIRVNGVLAGSFVKPESEAWHRENSELSSMHARLSPLGRLPKAAEVASVIRFLCSAGAAFVTGQHLLVDGGISLRGHEAVGRMLKEL